MPRIDAPTVAEHHARRRTDILTAAGRLFAERGVVATDLKDVAVEVGLSRTALYRYFPDRDRLFLAWADQLHAHVASALEQVLADPDDPRARLGAWIAYQLRHVAGEGHAVGRRVQEELGALPPELRDRIEDAHRDLQDRLAGTIAEIVGQGPDVGLLTRMVGSDAGHPDRVESPLLAFFSRRSRRHAGTSRGQGLVPGLVPYLVPPVA